MTFESEEPAGLYIHVPFCSSVCPYCDFAVLIAGEERRAKWADGVVCEAAMCEELGLRFDTIYLGGGTPSSLSFEHLEKVLEGVSEHLDVLPDTTIYLEANPEDVNEKSVEFWKSFGVGTVSLGVQSFNDESLRYLGRKHRAKDGRRAIECLRSAGIQTLSIDLIYGNEGQNQKDWRAQLEEAVALGVHHLSCYQLTFHTGTIFGRRLRENRVRQIPDVAQAELFFITHEVLADHGFEGYEVSNFARASSYRSHHNTKYWKHTSYLGLGPSAHSFVDGCRWWNTRKLRLWQRKLDDGHRPVEGRETLNPEQLMLETVMLSLRTSDGIDLGLFKKRFGVDLLKLNAAVVDRWRGSGHVRLVGRRLQPTLEGLAIADTLARSFEIS